MAAKEGKKSPIHYQECCKETDALAAGGQGRILAVDDEVPFLEAIRIFLEGARFRVDTATDAKEVFSSIKKNKYDVIIMDLRMPEISGLELIRRIKQMLSPPPAFIVLTGWGDKDSAVEALRLEVSDFLDKPIEREDILRAVEQALRKKRSPAGPFSAAAEDAALVQTGETIGKLKDELTQMLVHDMRSFITAIRGNAEVMKMYGDRAPRAECLSDIVMSADKLEWVVRDILDIKKMEYGKLLLSKEDFNAKEWMDDVVRGKAAELLIRDIYVHIDAPEDLKPLHGDYKILSRVLDNLLTNAMEHIEGRGGIFISCAFQREKRRHEIRVRDTGPGIPEEYIGKIFDKYFTHGKKGGKKGSGSGLGLAFCKMAIREHGGNITVQSKEGEGSCFTIFLPRQGR